MSVVLVFWSQRSFYDQHRARRQLHDAVGSTADHPFVELRMSGGADDEKIDMERAGKFDDVSYRMTRQHMGFEMNPRSFRHCLRASNDRVKAPGGGSCLFPDLFDEFRQIGNLLDRNHMKIRFVLLRESERQRECMEGVFGAVVGVQYLGEHRSLPISFSVSPAEAAALLSH